MTRTERENTISRTIEFDVFDVVAVNLAENKVEHFDFTYPRISSKITEEAARVVCKNRHVALVQMTHVKTFKKLAVWDLIEILPAANLLEPRQTKTADTDTAETEPADTTVQ